MASAKTLAKNEELFRNVNERIEEISAGVPRDQPLLEFLCECDRTGCEEKIQAARAEYESIRADPTHFIVLPGHDNQGGRAASWGSQLASNSSLTQGRDEFVPEAAAFSAPAPALLKESLRENFR